MPGSYSSSEAEEGNGAGSDDESCMSCRGSVSDPRWSRMTGGTKGWRLRGVEWRVKLGILPGNNASVDAMRRATADGRRKYADLRRRLLVDPHIIDEDQTASQLRMDNPLSQDPESVWGRYFRNAELEKTIDKDLSRLYPEHGVFFQSAPCQAMMRRILLVWSLIHPHFSYRQGMHELLAPLLYALHVDVVRLSQVKHRFEDLFDDRFDSLSLQEQHVRDKVESAKNFCGEMIVAGDSINFKGGVETTDDSAVDPEEQRVDLSVIIQGSDMYGVEGELGALLSARFLEHDVYCMLDALLDGQGGAVAMAEYFQSSSGGGKPPVIEASAALYRTLAAADISLYTHLVELGVEPQFFALRWLRLLFCREFVLEDLLRVWDAIFEADNTPLYQHGGEDNSEMKISQRVALISSFSVSMLLYVRPALLAAPDVTACLQRLLNFPRVPDVRDLIVGAKALQLLAQAAVKSPGKPLPLHMRTSEIKTNSKHVRSGSISPPIPQRPTLRPNKSVPSSPDILKLSMALPGSYWEEKWTHSVLQRKSPDELFSPRTARSEPIPRDSDPVDRDGSNTAATLSRSPSGNNCPDPVAASLSVRSHDSSPESSDDDGQEMLRRDGKSKESVRSGINTSIGMEKSTRVATEMRDRVRQNSEQDLSQASTSASALERGRSSRSGSPRPSSCVRNGQSTPLSSEALETVMFGDDARGSTDVVDRSDFTKSTNSDLSNERDLILQDTGLTRGESHAIVVPTGSSSEVSCTRTASEDNEASAAASSPKDTETSEDSSVEVQHELGSNAQSAVDTPIVGNEAPEVKDMSQNVEGKRVSSLSEAQPHGRGMESTGDHAVVEDGISINAEKLLPSKSKPPLPPSRLNRFNWVWSLGRSSFGAQAVTPKASKEDSPRNEATPPNPSGITASDSDMSIAAAANAAQRRKKSWWRVNTDVVPEECVATTSGETDNAVDPSSDSPGAGDSVKPLMESAAVPSGEQLKEGSVTQEIPVPAEDPTKQPQNTSRPGESQLPDQLEVATQPHDTTPCASAAAVQEQFRDTGEKPKDTTPSAILEAVSQQDTAKESKDMTPSAALQALGQDAAKKSKDMTPSAAIHALGQAVLEHVQVLEYALAQKVSVLGIENMWTPAVREWSENTDKAGLGSKGQGAARAAIAELRKISQALQQM